MSARAWSPLTLALLAACTSSNSASDAGRYDAPRDDATDAPDVTADVTAADVPMDTPADVASDVTPGDAGGTAITCGQAKGLVAPPACTPTRAVLDPQICRCILGYAWNGTRCAGLSNCHCYAYCEEVFPTTEACASAYAVCLDGGR